MSLMISRISILRFLCLMFMFLQIFAKHDDDDDDDDDHNNHDDDDDDNVDDFYSNFQSYEKGTFFPGSSEQFSKFMLIVALFFWPLILFFGYRLFKITLFSIGGITCGFICAMLAESNGESIAICVLIFILFFFIGGFLIVCCFKFGVFLVGYWAGMFLMLALIGTFAPSLNGSIALWVLVICFGVCCGFIALTYERSLIIIATSGLGSYFWLKSWNEIFPSHDRYGLAIGIIIFWIFGYYVQDKITSPISDGHPMERPLIPSQKEFSVYKSRTIILVYGEDSSTNKKSNNERLIDSGVPRSSGRNNGRGARGGEGGGGGGGGSYHNNQGASRQHQVYQADAETTSPLVYAAEVVDTEPYIPPAYAVPMEGDSGKSSFDSNALPPKLVKWFKTMSISNPQVLRDVAPIFNQVGATEPAEIPYVVTDKEIGSKWLMSLEQALPLAKRKIVLAEIRSLVDGANL